MKKFIYSMFSNSIIIITSYLLLFVILFTSCNNSTDPSDMAIDAFNNGTEERNMIVVISDLHLGADLAYSETKNNLKPLENFLYRIRLSRNVKELVIAGDMLDEWFIPASVDAFQGKGQIDFIRRIAIANKGVVNALNRIIKEGEILVTYVPGNHDLTVTAANVAAIFPGINQARDEMQGLGIYSPEDFPKIAIEHGHRYNFFCAPDPISNRDIAPGTITPPGYFFTRIAATHVDQNCETSGDVIQVVTPNTAGIASQNLLFGYWKMWEWALNWLPIQNKFNEKIIVTNVDGFTGSFSVNDILPYQITPGGVIDVKLYKGIQDTWSQRQILNKVAVNIPTAQAIARSAVTEESDDQARIQYFLNPNSDKRIVVFGHTHYAKIIASQNHKNEKSIYANSGTWIDHSPAPEIMTFVVIIPQNNEPSSQTFVKLYNFENEIITKMSEDSLRY